LLWSSSDRAQHALDELGLLATLLHLAARSALALRWLLVGSFHAGCAGVKRRANAELSRAGADGAQLLGSLE
jgi:hypothetical protein